MANATKKAAEKDWSDDLPKPKKGRPKQGHLEGMASASIKEIDGKAEEYIEARNNRMKMLVEEMDLHGELLELMQKHQLNAYNFAGFECRVVSTDKVKVRKAKSETDADGDDDDADDD